MNQQDKQHAEQFIRVGAGTLIANQVLEEVVKTATRALEVISMINAVEETPSEPVSAAKPIRKR